ncbi:hypothetical protein Lalb_Chr24g0399441 [Lupinus albus]|uniref:Uncharacterized protein n=1 Tax=Lupinus albus TaxID=3870 RepID=A0A6A4N961_LUPAL|nr:hypothetical protein Lalb_Chr24g0399441 [Lupinus albus]
MATSFSLCFSKCLIHHHSFLRICSSRRYESSPMIKVWIQVSQEEVSNFNSPIIHAHENTQVRKRFEYLPYNSSQWIRL